MIDVSAAFEARRIAIGAPLERALQVDMRRMKYRAVMLKGVTGIGKTEFIRKFGEARGYEVKVLDIAAMDPTDLLGLPMIIDGRTTFAMPEWMPTEGRGILFLDELNRAPLEVQQALYRLVLEGVLHEHKMPAGWIVWAAINPADSGDYQVSELDPALCDRFRRYTVVADRKEWLRWAKANDLHPAVLAVVREHEHVFDGVSPRAWERTSETLTALDDDELADAEFVRDLCASDLGDAWTETVLNVLGDMGPDGLIDAGTLLAGYEHDMALHDVIHGYHDAGQSDRLAALRDRIIRVVEGPELTEMIDKGELDLARFERLLRDLHGDYVRPLQEALGNNPAATRLLGLDAVIAAIDLKNYDRSELAARVEQWAADPLLAHRALLVATAVAEEIRRRPDADKLRGRTGAKRYLGKLLHRTGGKRAVRLKSTLDSLKIKVDGGAA